MSLWHDNHQPNTRENRKGDDLWWLNLVDSWTDYLCYFLLSILFLWIIYVILGIFSIQTFNITEENRIERPSTKTQQCRKAVAVYTSPYAMTFLQLNTTHHHRLQVTWLKKVMLSLLSFSSTPVGNHCSFLYIFCNTKKDRARLLCIMFLLQNFSISCVSFIYF
jgi:hypothetical protein